MAQSEMRPFEPSEIPKMMKAFEGQQFEYRNKALLALGVCTGFRIAELCALRINDVMVDGTIKKRLKLPKRLMKGSQPRHPKTIFPEAKSLLLTWIKEMRERFDVHERSHLFASKKGGGMEPNSYGPIIKNAAKRAGIPFHDIATHSMRKTFANAVYDYWDEQARSGRRVEPMRMTQLELGHATIDDTYRYMSFKLEEKPEDVFSKFNFLFHEEDSDEDQAPEPAINVGI